MNFKFELQAKLNIDEYGKILEKRGLENGGIVQQTIDSDCLKYMDIYVPKDTGMLLDSAIIHTVVGSGELQYKEPYSAYLYYNPQFNFQDAPTRGGKWFERMKINHKDDILNNAKRKAGAT